MSTPHRSQHDTMQTKEEDLFQVEIAEGRSEIRFVWQTEIDVTVRDRILRFETVNVSHGGIFVLAQVLPRVGKTVHLRMRLPPDDELVELQCVVRHLVDPDAALDAPPGFGLELAVPLETRVRWECFIEYLAARLEIPRVKGRQAR